MIPLWGIDDDSHAFFMCVVQSIHSIGSRCYFDLKNFVHVCGQNQNAAEIEAILMLNLYPHWSDTRSP